MESHPSPEGRPVPQSPRPASAQLVAVFAVGTLAIAFGAAWLLSTNHGGARWAQAYDPTGRWWFSTVIAALPILVLLGAMAWGDIGELFPNNDERWRNAASSVFV